MTVAVIEVGTIVLGGNVSFLLNVRYHLTCRWRCPTWLGLNDACFLSGFFSVPAEMGGNSCACLTASAPKSLRSSWAAEEEAGPAASKQEEAWPALGDRSLVPMVEQLFSHLLKVVNICAHVLDEVAPGPATKVTAGAPGFPCVPELPSCPRL